MEFETNSFRNGNRPRKLQNHMKFQTKDKLLNSFIIIVIDVSIDESSMVHAFIKAWASLDDRYIIDGLSKNIFMNINWQSMGPNGIHAIQLCLWTSSARPAYFKNPEDGPEPIINRY